MAAMTGSTDGTGTIVTLQVGQTLASWIAVGATVYGYTGGSYGTQVIGRGITITAINSNTTLNCNFTISTAGTANTSGIKIIISALDKGPTYALQQYVSSFPVTTNVTSRGAGYYGSDDLVSIDLASAGVNSVVWLFADTLWCTAAGQKKSQATFIHNSVGVQTGGHYVLNYDTSGSPVASTDTLSIYAPTVGATSPSYIFPNTMPAIYHWPQGGYCFNKYNMMVSTVPQYSTSGSITNPAKEHWFWVSNPVTSGAATTPNNWSMVEIPSPFLEDFPASTNVHNWLVPGDGYVYVLGMNTIGNNRNLYMTRFLYSGMNVGAGVTPAFLGIQYWCGPSTGWVGQDLLQTDENWFTKLYPVFNEFQSGFGVVDNNGSIYQKADNSYVVTNNPPFTFGYNVCVSSSLTSGWSNGMEVWFDSTLNTRNLTTPTSSYCMVSHPEMTWTGKSTDDMMFSYASNGTGGITDATIYWGTFIRVSGI